MVDGLQYAATHDNFFGSHVLRIPHDKLRFCMTGKRALLCLCNRDSRVMPDTHDKLAFLQTQTFLHLIHLLRVPDAWLVNGHGGFGMTVHNRPSPSFVGHF